MKTSNNPARCFSITGRFTNDIAATFLAWLNSLFATTFDNQTPVTILIDSPGGSASGAIGLVSLMRTAPMQIHTHGVGLIGGEAILLLAAGTGHRTINSNATILTLQSTFECGLQEDPSKDFPEDIARLYNDVADRRFEALVSLFDAFSSTTNTPWSMLLDLGDVLDASDALEMKIVDQLVDPISGDIIELPTPSSKPAKKANTQRKS